MNKSLIALGLLALTEGVWSISPVVAVAAPCQASKINAAGKGAAKLLKCHIRVARTGGTVDGDCLTKARAKLALSLAKADASGPCPGDATTLQSQVEAFVGAEVTALRRSTEGSVCVGYKLKSVMRIMRKVLKTYAKASYTGELSRLTEGLPSLNTRLSDRFAYIDGQPDCQTINDVGAHIVSIQAFAFHVATLATVDVDVGLSPASFAGTTVQTPAGEVRLDGTLNVTSGDDVIGQVTASYGTDGSALLEAQAGPAFLVRLGSDTVELVTDQAGQIALNGVSRPASDLLAAFLADSQAGGDPSTWSVMGQAMVAVIALNLTPVWHSNLEKLRASNLTTEFGGARGARTGSPEKGCLQWALNTASLVAAVGCGAVAGAACSFFPPTILVGAACGAVAGVACYYAGTPQLLVNALLQFCSAQCGNSDRGDPEECDGQDDSTCPGRCQIDCTCGTCGDGSRDVLKGEECDGTDDSACPGRCDSDCTCGTCGDDIADLPKEECDGSDNWLCSAAACNPDCTCALCGNGQIDISEECDGSAPGSACAFNQECSVDCRCTEFYITSVTDPAVALLDRDRVYTPEELADLEITWNGSPRFPVTATIRPVRPSNILYNYCPFGWIPVKTACYAEGSACWTGIGVKSFEHHQNPLRWDDAFYCTSESSPWGEVFYLSVVLTDADAIKSNEKIFRFSCVPNCQDGT